MSGPINDPMTDICEVCGVGFKLGAVCDHCNARWDSSPLSHQEGGDHYKTLKIQPVEFIHANGIPFIEGAIIKYVTRHKAKGKAADLRKARHFIDLLLRLEYGE